MNSSFILLLCKRVFGAIIILFLLMSSGCFQRTKHDSRIPEFSLPVIANAPRPSITEVKLPDLHGKLSILYFFGLDDCAICLFEIEHWAAARREIESFPINLIGITYTADVNQIEEFCNDYRIDFPICTDANQDLLRAIQNQLGEEHSQSPFKVILDQQTKIIDYESPAKETSKEEVIEKVKDYYQKTLVTE